LCRIKDDEARGYSYLYVQLRAGHRKTSDRFPVTDGMAWKLKTFLQTIGLTLDELTEENPVGRTGELIATAKNGKTYYDYES